MASRRFKAGLAASCATAAILTLGFGPFVRREAARVAGRYGGSLEVEHVLPAWRGVRLRGVDVALADVPSARIHVDEVDVRYRNGGRAITLRGGRILAVGPRGLVIRELEGWRARYLTSASGSQAGQRATTAALSGVTFQWQDDAQSPSEVIQASMVDITRQGSELEIRARDASVSFGRASIDLKNGRLQLASQGDGYRVKTLVAGSLEAQLSVPHQQAEARREAALPNSSIGARLRSSMISLAKGLDAVLEPGAKVHLDGVHARVHSGDEALTLGPGQLEVVRSADRLQIELAPELRAGASAGAREEALSFRLSVPLADSPGATQEIIADVQGGPIWLSTLGLREGNLGLFDVAHTSIVSRSHVVLSADGERVVLDGEGKVHGLSLRSAALSDEPVAGLELAFRAKGELDLDGARVQVGDAEIDLGAIRLVLRGDYEHVKGAYRVRGSFDVPLTACQAMLDAAPKGLLPRLQGLRMAGSFGIKGSTSFDTAHLDRGFSLDWDVSSTCRIVEAPGEIGVERFRRSFRRTAYDPDGKPVSVETGPGTPGWVPLSSVSKFMSVAVLTTEDGGFMRHHGFDQEAIRNSIRENLRKRKFVRGASTISMQLAKNLYLDRAKNLSRKLQEAILTMYLEQELTKEQILELYFNVVEFGPMIYGIGPAARYYFNTSPAELSLGQALYIASIMPNPRVQHFGAGGAVTRGWTTYLRKLMRLAHERQRITDEELEEGLREILVRGESPPQREPQRPPGLPGGDTEAEPPADQNDALAP